MVNDYFVPIEKSNEVLILEMKRIEEKYSNDMQMINWVKQNFCCNNSTKNISKLWHWAKSYFVYRPDSPEKYISDPIKLAIHKTFLGNPDEHLKNPIELMLTKTGDCDDFSLFAKTVFNILGIPSNYILIGDEKGFNHIAVKTEIGIVDIASDAFLMDYSNFNLKVIK